MTKVTAETRSVDGGHGVTSAAEDGRVVHDHHRRASAAQWAHWIHSALGDIAVSDDLRLRRISAKFRTNQAHLTIQSARAARRLAVDMIGQSRIDLDQRRLDAERRAAALVGGVRLDAGRRRGQLSFFDAEFCLVKEPVGLLTALLDAALSLTRAEMGNVQLMDPASHRLWIVAQRGFESNFLTYFDRINEQESACALAFARAETVSVHDVEHSPVFDAESRTVFVDAGVRAVHSIPLVASDGALLGVFSVHYRRPGAPDPAELRLLHALAASAARRLGDAGLRRRDAGLDAPAAGPPDR